MAKGWSKSPCLAIAKGSPPDSPVEASVPLAALMAPAALVACGEAEQALTRSAAVNKGRTMKPPKKVDATRACVPGDMLGG